jgi:hypothetical protein
MKLVDEQRERSFLRMLIRRAGKGNSFCGCRSLLIVFMEVKTPNQKTKQQRAAARKEREFIVRY